MIAATQGELMDNYAKEVEDFKFIPLEKDRGADFTSSATSKSASEDPQSDKENRRLRVTIGVNGWLNSEDDVTKPWRVLDSSSEVFALRYEMKTLLSLGTALQDLVSSFAWKTLKVEIIKRTALATLWAALWPIQVLAAASNVDNPFSRASNRSKKAGRLLADALINRVQGERPVTLIGYSLGATAIHACLQSLAERQAFGLVDNVVIMGTPAPSDAAHWRTLRCVVSGPIFNVYSENDMILGFVYRMHSLALGVAGLQAIEGVNGIQNVDLSERVSGHLRYPALTGEILRTCGFLGVQTASSGGDIEKDDVIKMKDEHAQGKLVDVEEAVDQQHQHQQPKGQGHDEPRGSSSPPAALSSSSPLPRKPVPSAGMHSNSSSGGGGRGQTSPPLPIRPAAAQANAASSSGDDSDSSPVTAHGKDTALHEGFSNDGGNAASAQKKRGVETPESNKGDDGEFMAITMENKE